MIMSLTKIEVQQRIDELRPWHFCFRLQHGLITGTSKPDYYEKIDIMTQAGAFSRPVYRKVLDLGANSGIVSVWFAQNRASKVLAVEAADVFYEQLEFAVSQKELGNKINTIRADITEFEPTTLYDCVLLLGVLHHIPLDKRQSLIDMCYYSLGHLGEFYLQTKGAIGAEEYLKKAGFSVIERICEWPGQNRIAWRCTKDPMKL